MVLRPTNSAIRPNPHRPLHHDASPSSATSTSGAAKTVTAPLSWKDAVLSASPPPPQRQAQLDTRSRHDPKPRHSTFQRTKLLRSRVAARIADAPAFRPVNDSVLSSQSTRTRSSSDRSAGCAVPEKPTTAGESAKTPKTSGSQQNAINGPTAHATATDASHWSRDRSASADQVLLRTSDFPRWLHTADVRKLPCTLESNDDELSELDCDDTNSESTVESSCPSPRHSPVVSGVETSASAPSPPQQPHALDALVESDESESVSDDHVSVEDAQDLEALLLLDRMNDLSAEFQSHRAYEEATALSWSVEHAMRQCVLSPDMAQNLHASVQRGAMDEVRDVLYHKCHLVPAVGSVVESPSVPAMHPAVAHAFLTYVEALAPTDAPAARSHKLHVLARLSEVLTRWVKAVAHARGLSEEHVAITRGALFLAGSYRLGLNDPLSDIDAVCVVPYHVTQDDFFGSFAAMLAHVDGVTHLAPVPHAYVPLISLSWLGVSLDLLFARLPMATVDAHHEIDSDHMLVGVHAPSMKSLNAPRVSAMLLCLVPKRRVFRLVLRAVRTWARRRGIYSAKLGYLGGISWAILVAFVCQMYPDAEPAKVFVRFFQVLSECQWPQPVMLNVIYDAGLGFEMWDPRQHLYDRAHIMPIITPAYPHMNSAVQVSQSTFSVMYEEIWRARYLAEAAADVAADVATSTLSSDADVFVSGVEHPRAAQAFVKPSVVPAFVTTVTTPDVARTTAAPFSPWEKLFEPSNFFLRYDTYLVADFQAATPSEMHQWGKFVTSRLRKLVDSVQHVSLVSRVHAFPRDFPHTSDGTAPGSCLFLGIEFHARRSSATTSSSSSVAVAVVAPKDDPEVTRTVEQTIRFFLATDLQQFESKQPSMTAAARLLSWDELPAFVFPSGRAAAADERVAYHANLEAMGLAQSSSALPSSFRPAQYSNSYARNGRWRSGAPRKYNGGGKGKLHRFRDSARTYPAMTQAG